MTCEGDVGLSVTDPHGADVPVTTEAVQNNSFRIGFQPTQPGVYDANVYFGDQQVPGSPFKVLLLLLGLTLLLLLILGLLKKVKFSHTRHRALGPELIPVYRQSARR